MMLIIKKNLEKDPNYKLPIILMILKRYLSLKLFSFPMVMTMVAIRKVPIIHS